MAGDEYSTAGGGLKLKGGGGGVTKKKKKKGKKPVDESRAEARDQALQRVVDEQSSEKSTTDETPTDKTSEEALHRKTDTEKRYEEMRRRRLEDRLKKEGVKTHKERVQDLNQYLSNLSRASVQDNRQFIYCRLLLIPINVAPQRSVTDRRGVIHAML